MSILHRTAPTQVHSGSEIQLHVLFSSLSISLSYKSNMPWPNRDTRYIVDLLCKQVRSFTKTLLFKALQYKIKKKTRLYT